MTRLTIIVAATQANGIGQNSRLPWHIRGEIMYFARLTSSAPEGHMNAVVMGRNTWESIPQKFKPLRKRINIVISSNKQYKLCVVLDPRVHDKKVNKKRRMPADIKEVPAPVYLHSNLESALERVSRPEYLEKPLYRTFIIGGASLYRETLALPPTSASFVDRIILTRIVSPEFEGCDIFMPDFQTSGHKLTETEHSDMNACSPAPWKRVSHGELRQWAGFDVPEGIQEENGIQYEYQMWVR